MNDVKISEAKNGGIYGLPRTDHIGSIVAHDEIIEMTESET